MQCSSMTLHNTIIVIYNDRLEFYSRPTFFEWNKNQVEQQLIYVHKFSHHTFSFF